MRAQVENRGLVLSVDAKPGLKWSALLHERFVDAVLHLGGPDKATPKSVMRIMGIPGITLYHLKSHLLKYRLAMNGHMNTLHESNEQVDDYRTRQIAKINPAKGGQADPLANVSMLQMQIEVQKKLQEQIEVQKHLQLRIEAQGKYLRSVLRKAQETLEGYSSSSMGVEAAKSELSELVSAVDTECLSSSFSGQTLNHKRAQRADCSTDSCLTSSDTKRHKTEMTSSCNWSEETDENNPNSSCSSTETNTKWLIPHIKKHRLEFDLNR